MRRPAPIKEVPLRDTVEIVERFEIITPMFGGGVHIDQSRSHDKKPDPLTPVRAASIRGQLRFWWRATQAHRFSSIHELREAEEELWGAASKPATVALEVNAEAVRLERAPVGSSSGIAYATFPLRPKTGAGAPGQLTRIHGQCVLALRCRAADAKEVQKALDAWLLFGGIGGRTRRGFGAVSPVDRELDPREFLQSLDAHPSAPPGVSALAGAKLVVTPSSFETGERALESALGALRDFRQKPGSSGTERATATRDEAFWPEPDTIRNLTRRSSPKHSEPTVHVRKFPRAAFGMPIVFHFKDHGHGDPGDTHLLPNGKERRASPLILRPLRVKGKFAALALVMVDTERDDEEIVLQEKFGRRAQHDVKWLLTESEAELIRPLCGEPDPLQAFIRFFENRFAR